MTLWSNPTPSGADSATLSSQYRVQAGDIGPLVHAILQYRQQQEQQQQKAYSDIAKGVAGAYSGYQQSQNASDANDAANAAIYGAQYPNDPYGGYSNPDVVPDYGGTSALAGIGAERKLNPEAFMSDYDKQFAEAKIALLQAQQAKASQPPAQPSVFTAPDGSQYIVSPHGGIHPLGDNSTMPGGDYSYLDTKNVTFDAKNPDMTYVNGQPMTDEAYKALVQGALRTKAGREAYGSTLQGNAPVSAPVGTATGSASVRQPDIDQATAQMSSERDRAVKLLQDNGKPITDANIKYVMDQLGGQ